MAAVLGLINSLPLGVTADLADEEVESLAGMDDRRLVLVEGQAPWRQPFGEPCLELLGLPLAVTGDDEESRPGESHPRPLAEPCVNVSVYTAPIAQPSGRRPNRQCANR
jgi:hypothetical protein